jgi:hypothetical protein
MRFVSLSCFDIFHFGFRRWRQQQQQRAREYRENRNWPKKTKRIKQQQSRDLSASNFTHDYIHTDISVFGNVFLFLFSKREKLVARRWMTRVC